jgi:DNA-binding response OmpR family regulator
MSAVLLVEDNVDICEMIRLLLGEENITVSEAHAGGEALAYLDHHTPDLVITDWFLPDLGGAEWLQRLRAVLPPDVPILALSAADDAAQATELGATEYLAKPFDPDELINCVNRLIGQRLTEGLP